MRSIKGGVEACTPSRMNSILITSIVALIVFALIVFQFPVAPSINVDAFSRKDLQQPRLDCAQTDDSDKKKQEDDDERVQFLMGLWEISYLNDTIDQPDSSSIPRAPHLEDCRKRSLDTIELDRRDRNGRRPRWTLWKGDLRNELSDEDALFNGEFEEEMLFNSTGVVQGPYPPWIEGADEDNLPMTRRVQRDLWLHQHPKNCSDPSVRFLLTDWSNSHRLGLGAQMVAMSGIFATAMNERRVLVTNYLNRADHEECTGSARGRWSCYFVPETSEECRARAMELSSEKSAWKQGIITNVKNYPKDFMWFEKVPEFWGKPWEHMQPSDVVDGELLVKHKAMDRQWWRAQAVRYLMRFPSEYLCRLVNNARHEAFGAKAAQLVIQSLPNDWPEVAIARDATPMENHVWESHRPWVPRPLLSIHVRQGDKASEMKIFDFKSHMDLAQRLRTRFPDVRDIWLSTEMENVVDESKNYTDWNFYFTKIPRQNGTTSMGDYETSLGRQRSSSNAFVNFMMAADSDYFIGALGSTWSFLIDGMRVTGGKVMAGFLSVNSDRFW